MPRRIADHAAAASGAQAIRRSGAWWHTPLGHERSTGWIREYDPLPPPWLGEPIDHHVCPDCAPDSPRTCLCTALLATPDPACRLCHGTGTRTWSPPCPTCAGTARVHHGVVLTVTDLADRVRHVNWRPDHDRHFIIEGAARGGAPVVRVGVQHLAEVSRGRPGARILIHAAGPRQPADRQLGRRTA